MRNFFFIIYFLFLAMAGHAQHNRLEYINRYQDLAIKEMERSGIPASIKMAQACLESGYGNSELSRKSNNHFGIKCKRHWKGKKIYYDDDRKNECFRKYKSVKASFTDHTDFLMSNPRYAFLFELQPGDYKGWARGLKKAGYATAPHYDKRLIKIIEENKLYKLDSKQGIRPLLAYHGKQALNRDMNQGITINPFQVHEIIKINDMEAVIARESDTYEIIAEELDMEAWELYKYNDRPEGYQPRPREVIYTERKKRRAPRNFLTHEVREGETMHYISQLYGIRLKPLYRRNRMDYSMKVSPGDVVYLRKRKPAH